LNTDKAFRLRNLGADPAFQEALEDVLTDQARIFLKPESTAEQREAAHGIVVAIARIQAKVREAANHLTVAERTADK
jgi:predicted alternative tryptophan synthase beta-subunit